MKTLAKYHVCNHCVIGEKTFTNILIGPQVRGLHYLILTFFTVRKKKMTKVRKKQLKNQKPRKTRNLKKNQQRRKRRRKKRRRKKMERKRETRKKKKRKEERKEKRKVKRRERRRKNRKKKEKTRKMNRRMRKKIRTKRLVSATRTLPLLYNTIYFGQYTDDTCRYINNNYNKKINTKLCYQTLEPRG